MAPFKSLVISAIFSLGAVCSVGGGMIYQLITPAAQQKPKVFSSLFATAAADASSDKNVPELYSGGNKNYKCVLTAPAKNDTDTKKTETDPWCQVYSVDEKADTSIQLKNLAHQESQEQKTDKEIKQKDQIKASDNQKPVFYQISIDKDVLDKFKDSDYSNLEVKLVENSTTDYENGKHIAFNPRFRFDKAGDDKSKGVPMQGTTRGVIVQIISEEHKCTSQHKKFKLGEDSGYYFFNLSDNGSTSITKQEDIKSKHTSGLKTGPKDILECSKVEKGKFYVLTSPSKTPFKLHDLYKKELELTCSGCATPVKAKVWRMLMQKRPQAPKQAQ